MSEGQSKPQEPAHDAPPFPPAAMSFTDHLGELRTRLMYSGLFLIFGCIISFIFTRKYIFPWVISPWRNVTEAKLLALAPTEKFFAFFRVGFAAGLVIAIPLILHQLWLFIRPGLRPREHVWVRGMLLGSFLLFLAGCAFCFYLVVPLALRYLLGFEPGIDLPTEITTNITLEKYFSFAIYLTLAGGFVFQIPLVVLVLSLIGLVTPMMLVGIRKYAFLGSVILAAALTPTGDPITLAMLGLPIYILYEVSIVISKIVYRKKQEAVKVEPD